MIGRKVKMKQDIERNSNLEGIIIDEFTQIGDKKEHIFMIKFNENKSGMHLQEEFDYIEKTVSELKDTPWPMCSTMCLMIEKCGASECDSCCPEKFEEDKNDNRIQRSNSMAQ